MRRHTLSGSAAAENHQNHHRGKEWLASEREKFLELLRVRHPSQAAAVENELEWQSGRSGGGPNRRGKSSVRDYDSVTALSIYTKNSHKIARRLTVTGNRLQFDCTLVIPS